MTSALDLEIESAVVHGQLRAGVSPSVLAARTRHFREIYRQLVAQGVDPLARPFPRTTKKRK